MYYNVYLSHVYVRVDNMSMSYPNLYLYRISISNIYIYVYLSMCIYIYMHMCVWLSIYIYIYTSPFLETDVRQHCSHAGWERSRRHAEALISQQVWDAIPINIRFNWMNCTWNPIAITKIFTRAHQLNTFIPFNDMFLSA